MILLRYMILHGGWSLCLDVPYDYGNVNFKNSSDPDTVRILLLSPGTRHVLEMEAIRIVKLRRQKTKDIPLLRLEELFEIATAVYKVETLTRELIQFTSSVTAFKCNYYESVLSLFCSYL